jgi:hypothetical protein
MRQPRDSAPATLRRTQQGLASVVLQPEKLDDPAFWSEIRSVIAVAGADYDARVRAIERLRAYTSGLPARMFEALSQDHPALEHVIGSNAFRGLVHRYLPHVPTGIYNLNDVGSSFPEFLSGDDLVRAYPFAADLARLERAVRLAFHAREGTPLDAATLAGWTLQDWSVAVLDFQPSVAVVTSTWPIRDIWLARYTPIEEIDITLEGRPDRVLVHRSGYDVVCESVGEDEAWALEELLARRSLGDVAEGLVARRGDPDDVGSCFARWQARGMVTGCRRC